MANNKPPRVQCINCEFFRKDCGYWRLEGTKDKNGNTIAAGSGLVMPETYHGCPDYRPRPYTQKEVQGNG